LHLIAAFALAAACDQDQPKRHCSADEEVVGDPTAPPQIEVIEMDPNGVARALTDGDTMTVFTPPQGGGIVYVGARVRNMAPCQVTVTGNLRDPTREGQPVFQHEGRELQYVEMEDRPGWAEPRLRGEQVLDLGPNIPACGSRTFPPRDVSGCEWILEVRARDFADRSVATSFTVFPDCPADDPGTPETEPENEQALCRCQCATGLGVDACNDLDPFRDRVPDCVAE